MNIPIQKDHGLTKILKTLIESDDPVSGTLIGESLGCSRTTVHTKIEQLKSEGFGINAASRRGYVLETIPENLNPTLLSYYSLLHKNPIPIYYYNTVDSTNLQSERLFSNGVSPPFCVIGIQQTKGKGRLGRKWQSQCNKNLYASIMLSPKKSPQKLQSFTLWAGIEICRSLKRILPNIPLKVKWPNDLYCRNKKFAGMLTEARIDQDCIQSIIFGLGLNINTDLKNMPHEIQDIATSLKAESKKNLDMNLTTIEMISAIVRAYKKCLLSQTSEPLVVAWEELDFLKGKEIRLLENGSQLAGIGMGINSVGALQIRIANGTIRSVYSGDVTLS